MNPGCFCLPSSHVTMCPIFFGDLPFPRCVGLMGLWITLCPAILAWPILETFSPGHSHLSRVRLRSTLDQLERFSGVLLVDTGRHPFFLEAINLKLCAATSCYFFPLLPTWRINVKGDHEVNTQRRRNDRESTAHPVSGSEVLEGCLSLELLRYLKK